MKEDSELGGAPLGDSESDGKMSVVGTTGKQLSPIAMFRSAVDVVGFTTYTRAKAILDHNLLHDDPEKEHLMRDDKHLATLWGTARSLINAAVSGGVLVLAFQIPKVGSVQTSVILLLTALMLGETVMMLFKSSLHYGTSSYTGTAKAAWGTNAARFVTLALALGQYGVLVGYANVMRDTIPWVIQYNAFGCVDNSALVDCELPWYGASWFIISILMAVFILPISLKSDPDVFSKISFTTFVHFGLFLALVVYGAFIYWPSNESLDVYTSDNVPSNGTLSESLFPVEESVFNLGLDSTVAIAILAFAMTAHTTALPILHGTRIQKGVDREERTNLISKVVFGSMLAVFVYYVWIMLGCYIAFGNSVQGNCLSSFPSSNIFAMVVRFTYAFELSTSIPIFLYSMRRDMTATFLGVSGDQTEMDQIESENYARTALITIFLLGTSTVLGVLGSLELILGFTGAVVTSLNAYVFPALLYFSTGISGWERMLCIPLALFGMFVLVVSLYQQINLVL